MGVMLDLDAIELLRSADSIPALVAEVRSLYAELDAVNDEVTDLGETCRAQEDLIKGLRNDPDSFPGEKQILKREIGALKELNHKACDAGRQQELELDAANITIADLSARLEGFDRVCELADVSLNIAKHHGLLWFWEQLRDAIPQQPETDKDACPRDDDPGVCDMCQTCEGTDGFDVPLQPETEGDQAP